MSYPPFVEHVHCESAEDFLDFLRLSRDHWHQPVESRWLFRGHADSEWQLLPRAWRQDGIEALRPWIEQIINTHSSRFSVDHLIKCYDDRSILKHNSTDASTVLSILNQAERFALYDFGWLCNEIGLEIGEWHGIMSNDILIFLPIVSMAQHHGVPTFLLDWTTDPLVAAHFACTESSTANRIAVWALDTRATCSRPEALNINTIGAYDSPRRPGSNAYAQRSVFTFITHLYYNNYVIKNGWYPTILDTLSVRQIDQQPPCMKIATLDRRHVMQLRTLLQRENITLAHIMPSYDNVVKSTKQLRSDLAASFARSPKLP